MRQRQPRGSRSSERAVSELLSFVLVFGIILTSVAVLSMTGFQAMDEYREGEQLRNGERAVEALAHNFNDVLRYDGINQRHGELTLRNGAVVTGDGGTELTIADEGGEDSFEETYELGAFAYEHGSDRVAYEGGGVVRADGTGSAVIADPLLTCQERTALVSLVEIDAADRSI